jgi:ER membrane protein complex subunit 3
MLRYRAIPSGCANLLNCKAANQVAQQMAQMNPGAAMMGPDQDPDKLFLNEAENLEVMEHHTILDGVEDRLLANLA